MEARPAGTRPVVMTPVAATLEEAIDGAVERLERVLDVTFSTRHDPKGSTPPGEVASF